MLQIQLRQWANHHSIPWFVSLIYLLSWGIWLPTLETSVDRQTAIKNYSTIGHELPWWQLLAPMGSSRQTSDRFRLRKFEISQPILCFIAVVVGV